MGKKRIAIVSIFGNESEGGVERVVYYLKELLQGQFDVEILSMKRSYGKLNLFIYPVWLSLRLFLRKRDVVISQAWHSWLYPADFVISHGTTKESVKQVPEEKTPGSVMIMLMEKLSVHRSRRVWAVSSHCKKELVRQYGVSPDKITVFNNFVDEDIFYPMDDTRADNKIILLFAGRLSKRKGLERLLKVSKYIEHLDDCELHIACNDSSHVSLFDKFHNTKIRTGLSLDKMNEFYNSGDILYFPTRYEGFSMVTLEALSSGLPVIGTGFAVPEELRKYPYVRIYEGEKAAEVVWIAREMKHSSKNKRNEIHQVIARDFGKSQYKKKLLKQVNDVLENDQ